MLQATRQRIKSCSILNYDAVRPHRLEPIVKECQSMKPITRLSACTLAWAGCVLAAEPSASVQKAIASAEKKWTAAVLKSDKSALDMLLSPDLTYTHSSAKTQTKQEFLNDVSGTTTYKSIEFADTKMRQFGTAVVVTHTGVFTTVQTGVNHLYITEVWAQESGKWLLVARQATKLPETK